MVFINRRIGMVHDCIKFFVMNGWKRFSSYKSKLEAFKTVILIIVLVAEVVLPYAFYLGLMAFGDSKEKMWVLQYLMILLTSGIFLGLLLSLVKDSFG